MFYVKKLKFILCIYVKNFLMLNYFEVYYRHLGYFLSFNKYLFKHMIYLYIVIIAERISLFIVFKHKI